MSDINQFPIAKRWPAKHPERLQLYSLPTPNGGESLHHARRDRPAL
ncbi:Uncharacterised protein [Serratia fonticola]|uniref:Glutathione S-transferase n=1 Tax=Serratia fonticola TaxID=47917 RepID=A0A4U9TEF3_SERFO|nr:Uncharacterised protein [Serratia fonticola]